MQRIDARFIFGLLLIGGGVIYLLQNLGLITWGPLVWAIAFAVGGLAFLSVFARDRLMWWALIPGLTLLGLAGLLTLQQIAPAQAESWGGSLFLGAIGLAFLIVYAANRQFWWAIIPGGVLLTLAVVAGVDRFAELQTGGVFFLGLGATFALVALAPNPQGPMRWAFIPAAVLAVMGLLLLVGFITAINYLWPAALILAGLFLLARAFRRRA